MVHITISLPFQNYLHLSAALYESKSLNVEAQRELVKFL